MRFVFALPIFTASHPATIVGVHVLNFCVRDGNRWTHMTINTNSFVEEVFPFLFSKLLSADFCYSPPCNLSFGIGDPYRIRTDVNGVRGRCLNHLTNGPLVQLQGLEPGTHWLRVSCSTNWAKAASIRQGYAPWKLNTVISFCNLRSDCFSLSLRFGQAFGLLVSVS